MAVTKNRIWELDALRGLFILCVVLVHTIFDLQLFGFVGEDTPVLFNIIRDYGGILFVLSLPASRTRCIILIRQTKAF